MTYRELFYKATRLLDNGKITLGEYEKMTKPLDREVEQEPILDKLKADIENEIRFWQEPSKCGNADKRVRVAKVTSYKHMLELIESIKALEQESTTKIEESNFSQEQYKTDLQCAYDCGKSILDKIRAEINNLTVYYTTKDKGINLISQKAVNRIFDKYKAESEK